MHIDSIGKKSSCNNINRNKNVTNSNNGLYTIN